MKHIIYIQVVLITAGTSIKYVSGETSSAIPELLLDCYRANFTIVAKPPSTLLLLLELIRKIELDQRNAVNARMLSTSMLHSVVLDGIRKSKNMGEENTIPYRATGREFDRYRLIVDYIVPGQSLQFPADSLSKSELCFLHKMLSNAVDETNRGDEEETCGQQTLMSLKGGQEDDVSECPLARGNIRTSWGPISAGHLLAGIAAVLDQNIVTFGRLQESINDTREIKKPVVIKETQNVDTLWVSTVAGDLGEAILKQANVDLQIGNVGFWDDHLLPRAYYLKSDVSDFYDAEVLGAIDGVNIASNVYTMSSDITKLSQLIDMYYAEGPTNDINVANRLTQFNQALQKINLLDQVIGTASLLQGETNYDVALNSAEIKLLSTKAVDKFKQTADNISRFYGTAERIPNKRINTPLELIAIIDETWNMETAQKILYGLAETIQVSHYGSRMGVINGLTGKWLANVTNSVFQMFTEFHSNRNTWPTSSTISVSLRTVMQYYQNTTYADCRETKLIPKGRAIIILAPSSRLTTEVFRETQDAIKSIKSTYPETNLIFVASDQNHNTFSDLMKSSNGNDTLMYNVKDANTLVAQLADKLSYIPASIISPYCNKSVSQRMEDYITPNVETIYEIHTEYIRRSDIEIKFKGHGYGDVTLCVLMPEGNNNRDCKLIKENDISLKSRNYCAIDSRCYLQFSVTANNSNSRCLENECRYPNQVRIDIISKHNSAGQILSIINIFLITTLSVLINEL